MNSAGYSGTPLAKKLGIKEGFTLKLINLPENYFNLFADFPKEVKIATKEKSNIDFIHYFSTNKLNLGKDMAALKKQLSPDGMIWVSWYKKSAKIPTDITEDIVRDLALKNGLVDIKVCAIDEVWSGLKLVIPVKDRKKKSK
jgi:hypothetical protein